jgi:hypothetical protein
VNPSEGFVYLAKTPSLPNEYKIGCSIHPWKRVKALAREYDVDNSFSLIATFPAHNRFYAEQYVHHELSDDWIRRELFSFPCDSSAVSVFLSLREFYVESPYSSSEDKLLMSGEHE